MVTVKTTLAYLIGPFFISPIMQLSVPLCKCQSLIKKNRCFNIYGARVKIDEFHQIRTLSSPYPIWNMLGHISFFIFFVRTLFRIYVTSHYQVNF